MGWNGGEVRPRRWLRLGGGGKLERGACRG